MARRTTAVPRSPMMTSESTLATSEGSERGQFQYLGEIPKTLFATTVSKR